MKTLLGLLGIIVMIGSTGCVVSPAYPAAGVSVGVYDEYPYTTYGYGGYYPYRYHRWHHPYDRDRYFYRRGHYWY